MEKTTGKEGKGVQGTGFDAEGDSNSYSMMPRSSNAFFGIDEDVARGESEAASTPTSKGQNVGTDTGSTGEDNMSPAKFGIPTEMSMGTVRGGLEGVNEKRQPGEFGVSAKSGRPPQMLNEDGYYGSGARKAGTAAQFGEPGRGGSMALAIKGLSGSTGGMPKTEQPAMGAQKSKEKGRQGLKGSGGDQ